MKVIASNGMEINTGDEVLVKNGEKGVWRYCYFSHFNEKSEFPYATSFSDNEYCIPYKGNEDLVGTNKDFTKLFEFKFGAKVRAWNNYDSEERNGILIGQDLRDTKARYYVAFPINDEEGGNANWFSDIEYI